MMNESRPRIAGIVLCGGRSLRMGRSKALLDVWTRNDASTRAASGRLGGRHGRGRRFVSEKTFSATGWRASGPRPPSRASETKPTRRIPVYKAVAVSTRRLTATAPKGSGKPLFRNTKGEPRKRMTCIMRFLSINEKLRWNNDSVRGNFSSYTCRHTFWHRTLLGYQRIAASVVRSRRSRN